MKRVLTLVFAVVVVMFLSSCSNEQIKDAIDQCKNDPECYVIIDEEVDQVLNSKGIQGGQMTNIEMVRVLGLIDEYIIEEEMRYSENQLNVIGIYLNELLEEEVTDELLLFESAFSAETDEDRTSFLSDFKSINKEFRQYIIEDETKYLIYKESYNRFVLEVVGLEMHIYTIDLDLDRIYYGNEAMYKVEDNFSSYLEGILDSDITKLKFDESIGMITTKKDPDSDYTQVTFLSADDMFRGDYYIVRNENELDLQLNYFYDGKSNTLEVNSAKLHQSISTTYELMFLDLLTEDEISGEMINETNISYIKDILSMVNDFEVSYLLDEEYREGYYYLQVFGDNGDLLFDDNVINGEYLYDYLGMLNPTSSDESRCFLGYGVRDFDLMPESDLTINGMYKECTSLMVYSYEIRDYHDNVIHNDGYLEGNQLNLIYPKVDYRVDDFCFAGWDNKDVRHMPSNDLIVRPEYIDCSFETETSISEILQNYDIGDDVTFTGFVSGIAESAFFISDGMNSLLVYTSNRGVQLGDIITIKGVYTRYNQGYELTGIETLTIHATGNRFNHPKIQMTIEDFIALDITDSISYTNVYTLTGTIEMESSRRYKLVDGDFELLISYINLDNQIFLEEYNGMNVTIDLFLYTNHPIDGRVLSFAFGIEDLIINE